MLRRALPRLVDKKTSDDPISPGWEYGAMMRANNWAGQLKRENLARGKNYDMDPAGKDRPMFDLMGKLQAWGKEKECLRNPDNYFYLDFLIDLEGYPEEVRQPEALTRMEHMSLRLLSLAEERKFWKSYLFYVDQYEFENGRNIEPYSVARTECIEYSLRQAGIASPKYLKEFLSHGLDDHLLAGVSKDAEYKTTNFTDDMLNILDGAAVFEMLRDYGLDTEQIYAFVQALTMLKAFPVKVLDIHGTVIDERVIQVDEAPTLPLLSEAFGLEGGHDEWYYDVRNFYSTPGRMLFDEYAYQNFVLDWYLSGAFKHGVGGDKCVHIVKRPPRTEEVEDRRGWLNII
eukprot:Rhum_TRINITY_DN25644_c0_g1::Rhum_TRINITY_DN25644_c0_g1_i1::g.182460::m.182460